VGPRGRLAARRRPGRRAGRRHQLLGLRPGRGHRHRARPAGLEERPPARHREGIVPPARKVGHGQMLYRVSQDLGKTRDAMLRDLITGKTKYHNVFNYPAPTWGDIAMIQWLIDGAAIMNQKTLADGSSTTWEAIVTSYPSSTTRGSVIPCSTPSRSSST